MILPFCDKCRKQVEMSNCGMQSPVKQVLPADNIILTLAIFHKVSFVWFYPTGRGATIFSGVAASSQGHYLSAAK